MKVVILCGGKGTRAYPHTQEIPKALMRINGVTIVENVIQIYAAQGYREFILSCGYLKEKIIDYFDRLRGDWNVTCVDTGEDADTGDRIWNLRHLLGPTFHATYCDGLGDIELAALQRFHEAHDGLATVTAVPLRSQYGVLHQKGDGRVVGFEEKPVLHNYWINGGFFVFNRDVFDYWQGQNLEKEVLPELARLGKLHMYKHFGFWRSMDTYKDQQELDSLWAPIVERFVQETTEISEISEPASQTYEGPYLGSGQS
jgi:glucose-1-phosphate cytidylyltransferase